MQPLNSFLNRKIYIELIVPIYELVVPMVISKTERGIVMLLFRDLSSRHNASTISGLLGVTPRGALKALKHLEAQQFVASEHFGRAIEFKLKYNAILKKSVELFLLEEAELNHKRWVEEFKNFSEADIILLFGSALRKDRAYNDIDLLLVVEKAKYNALKKKIDEKNAVLPKMIHPIFQTQKDINENFIKKDKVVLNAVKTGVVLKGYSRFVEAIADAASR